MHEYLCHLRFVHPWFICTLHTHQEWACPNRAVSHHTRLPLVTCFPSLISLPPWPCSQRPSYNIIWIVIKLTRFRPAQSFQCGLRKALARGWSSEAGRCRRLRGAPGTSVGSRHLECRTHRWTSCLNELRDLVSLWCFDWLWSGFVGTLHQRGYLIWTD